MVLGKKGIIIAAAGLVFVVGAVLANIFLFPGVSPYLLTAALGSLTLSILLLFLPRLFKDHTPKIYRHKLANTISLFFSAKDRQNKFFHCILALSLLLLFVIRSLSKHDYLEDVSALQSTFLQPFQVGFAAILNCWWVGAMIYSLVAQFVQTDLLRNIEKWVAAPILFLITLFLPCCFEGVAGELSLLAVSPQALMMGFEYAIMVSFALESWLKDSSLKMSKSLGYGLLVAWLLLLLTTINDYLPKNLIGEYVRNLPLPKKFNLTHRIFIYTAFLLPIFYYLLLFPFDYTHRRAFLFFIALSVLFAYASVKRIEVWQHFYSMPLHLCNTAMYIMPLTLAFRSYRLFYFTMFINVIGAFLALMMPNYSDSWPTLGTAIVEFYINHIYAATLPVLIIELGIFERPKWKYFGYSMAGFAVYFVFVAVLNIYYTGTKSLYGIAAPDYFFINSDFIAKKVGTWAEDLWKMDFVWTQNGYTFELHWPYLLSYFSVYVLFALGMWYVYEILFKSTDELILLHENSRQYHVSQLQFEKLQERRDLPMEQNENSHEPRLLISHFTKRYGNAKTPAVEDFSLDISGGKIYGFLGKNGAGKSTIIKAVVGMHETGHLLGLDDYYSYTPGESDYTNMAYKYEMPTGGLDMMDLNILDHDAWSKFALGWNRPYVITEDLSFPLTFELEESQVAGDFVLIPAAGEGYNGTAFGEYLMIELYTPDNLNELDSKTKYAPDYKYPRGFFMPGVKISHVDARMARYANRTFDYNVDMTTFKNDIKSSTASSYYRLGASNSANRSSKEGYRLIHLLEGNGTFTFGNQDYEKWDNEYFYANNSTLFEAEDERSTFDMTRFSSFFLNRKTISSASSSSSSSSATLTQGLFNNGREFPYTIRVNGIQGTTIEGETTYKASLTIVKA